MHLSRKINRWMCANFDDKTSEIIDVEPFYCKLDFGFIIYNLKDIFLIAKTDLSKVIGQQSSFSLKKMSVRALSRFK